MSWDKIEGQWKQRRGKAVHQWGKMMNDDLATIAGTYEELVGRLQEKYGIAKDEAKEQLDLFKKTVGQLEKSNSKLIEIQKLLTKQREAIKKPVKARKVTTAKQRTRKAG